MSERMITFWIAIATLFSGVVSFASVAFAVTAMVYARSTGPAVDMPDTLKRQTPGAPTAAVPDIAIGVTVAATVPLAAVAKQLYVPELRLPPVPTEMIAS